APEAEAVALDRRHVRIDGKEFRRGWLGTALAELGPSGNEVAVLRSLDNHAEAADAVGRYRGGTRLVRRTLGDQFQGRAEIKTDLTVLVAIEPFAFTG